VIFYLGATLPHYRAPKFVDKRWPLTEGFKNISVCSNSRTWGQLSPMKLGPVPHDEVDENGKLMPPALNMENLWQATKVKELTL
jgi:hypothetical protein